mmetsp:Transcript_35129/g.84787  ORF Transcript_35129/g.84787 Transcript_35129/m.84787 type:complete len:311 (-) Transcript_35129:911-1843(-)
MLLCQSIELSEKNLKHTHDLVSLHPPGNGGKAHDIDETDRRDIVLLDDRFPGVKSPQYVPGDATAQQLHVILPADEDRHESQADEGGPQNHQNGAPYGPRRMIFDARRGHVDEQLPALSCLQSKCIPCSISGQSRSIAYRGLHDLIPPSRQYRIIDLDERKPHIPLFEKLVQSHAPNDLVPIQQNAREAPIILEPFSVQRFHVETSLPGNGRPIDQCLVRIVHTSFLDENDRARRSHLFGIDTSTSTYALEFIVDAIEANGIGVIHGYPVLIGCVMRVVQTDRTGGLQLYVQHNVPHLATLHDRLGRAPI